MVRGVLRQCWLLPALLWASAGLATEVLAVASNPDPKPGESFTVLVKGTGFPQTLGATLGLTFDSSVVNVTGVELAQGSPFTLGGTVPRPFPSGTTISVLGPEEGTPPSGDFDAFVVRFTRIAAGDPKIVLLDNGTDQTWVSPDEGKPIPVQYLQVRIGSQGLGTADAAAAPPEERPATPEAPPQSGNPVATADDGSASGALWFVALGVAGLALVLWFLWRSRK